MRVGKNSFPGHAGNGVTGALRTAGNTLGLSRALFIPWKIPKTGRIRPKPLSGAGTPPPPPANGTHSNSQAVTLGALASAGGWPPAGVPLPAPAPPAGGHSARQLPLR